MPIAIFLIESYVHNIPVELEEAAILDGCSFSRKLFSIVLPICKPVLVTAGIIQFFTCWNEFSFALILISKNNLVTLPVGMTLFKGGGGGGGGPVFDGLPEHDGRHVSFHPSGNYHLSDVLQTNHKRDGHGCRERLKLQYAVIRKYYRNDRY
jgi:hypothetical protein